MRLNILIGGKAGQGINKISSIVSNVLVKQGYYIFNYRDYPSVIRGSHNFNVLSICDKEISSHESKLDGIIAMDDLTIPKHKREMKKRAFTIKPDKFLEFGINLNVALAGALIKKLGFDKKILIDEIKIQLNNKKSLEAAEKGFASQEKKFTLKKIKNNLQILDGSSSVAKGALGSKLDLYISYPMTPSTLVLHLLAKNQKENSLMVFQPENEISVANSAIGASFSGAKVMVGTSGGGYDLMSETLSLQGMSEIPLTVYLASRPGPGTGIPTYTMQGDLDVALRSGHGEFPRAVIAPGTPEQAIEKTNEAIYLSQKFNTLSILLSDKHLAESSFSFKKNKPKFLKVEVKRKVPGEAVVKASGYEHDAFGNTKEDAKIAEIKTKARVKKYFDIKKECEKLEMIKIYGAKNSKNLIIGWGSTTGAICDAIKDLDAKFLQVLYLKPVSDKIRNEIKKAKQVILVENNVTGQLGRLLREKTGKKIEKRILKYDGRSFTSDELKKQLKKWI